MLDALDHLLLHVCGLRKDAPILAGVSGGPDSLCLLAALHEAGWRVVAAHFNHRLRPEAEDDAAAVRDVTTQLGIPHVEGQGDVRQYADEHKLSIETAARELRYRFLFAQAHEVGAQAVAVGHTADDQVETVLMHLLRGAGLNGLKGMPYRALLKTFDAAIPLVRPLLDVSRSESVAYCEARGLPARYDATNESLDYLRNRVRKELIPNLESYNPRVRDAIWRTARTLAADHDLLTELLDPLWTTALSGQGEQYLMFDGAFLKEQSDSLRMHLVSRGVRMLMPEQEVDYGDLRRAADFIGAEAGERADLGGGLYLWREEGTLFLAAGEDALPCDQWPQAPETKTTMPVGRASRIRLLNGWQLTCEPVDLADLADERWKACGPYEAFVDLGSSAGALELRARRDGDRIDPLGMEGHAQKLSDFFVNVKLPRRARDRWPLVCQGDQVVWVPGYRISHRFRVTPNTQAALHLAVKRIE